MQKYLTRYTLGNYKPPEPCVLDFQQLFTHPQISADFLLQQINIVNQVKNKQQQFFKLYIHFISLIKHPKIFTQLIQYCTNPKIYTELQKPYIASQILAIDNKELSNYYLGIRDSQLIKDDDLCNTELKINQNVVSQIFLKIFEVLKQKEILETPCGYIVKILNRTFNNLSQQFFIFLSNNQSIYDRLIYHIYNKSICEFIAIMLQAKISYEKERKQILISKILKRIQGDKSLQILQNLSTLIQQLYQKCITGYYQQSYNQVINLFFHNKQFYVLLKFPNYYSTNIFLILLKFFKNYKQSKKDYDQETDKIEVLKQEVKISSDAISIITEFIKLHLKNISLEQDLIFKKKFFQLTAELINDKADLMLQLSKYTKQILSHYLQYPNSNILHNQLNKVLLKLCDFYQVKQYNKKQRNQILYFAQQQFYKDNCYKEHMYQLIVNMKDIQQKYWQQKMQQYMNIHQLKIGGQEQCNLEFSDDSGEAKKITLQNFFFLNRKKSQQKEQNDQEIQQIEMKCCQDEDEQGKDELRYSLQTYKNKSYYEPIQHQNEKNGIISQVHYSSTIYWKCSSQNNYKLDNLINQL